MADTSTAGSGAANEPVPNPLEANRIAITAGAGAGKTYTLVERYMVHIERENLSPLQVVAVTFTEAAAAELRSRIREEMIRRLGDDDDRIAELEAARICTFHSLAAAICRQHPAEAGVPADFSILDEIQGPLWLTERLDDALDSLPFNLYKRLPFTKLRSYMRALMRDPAASAIALARRARHWKPLIDECRSSAQQRLIDSAPWQSAKAVLRDISGLNGDKLEPHRQNVVSGIAAFEAGDDADAALRLVASAAINVGSASNWNAVPVAEVKVVIRDVRDLVRAELAAGLVNLTIGPGDKLAIRQVGDLRRAFRLVQEKLQSAKREQRVLDYSDLEIHALESLQNPKVQRYYHERWLAFLVDEFQDTNRAQAEVLEKLLHRSARLAVVGDENQSIYGFRRADPKLFREYQSRIETDGGRHIPLLKNWRSNRDLISHLNAVFINVFSGNGQSYVPQGCDRPAPESSLRKLRVFRVTTTDDQDPASYQRSRSEAINLARLLRELHDGATPVHDRSSKTERAMQWGDIAILSRTWSALDTFADALGSMGIPYVLAGGGNLLVTREARDGYALLRFLAEPTDDLALAAVLKSPFCSVSDYDLLELRKSAGGPLWEALADSNGSMVNHRCFLDALLKHRSVESPSRLLHIADCERGYSAIMSNLPGGERRLADWQGFCRLVKTIERVSHDTFSVARVLRQVVMSISDRDSDIAVNRPVLEAGNAVSLMTVHRAKGLEWPLVAIVDLAKAPRSDDSLMLVDPEVGLSIKGKQAEGEQLPCLFRYLKYEKAQREIQERRRLLYVAATRARDYLVMTTIEPRGSKTALDELKPGLLSAGIETEAWTYTTEDSLPPLSREREVELRNVRAYINPIEIKPGTLPVTSLAEYEECPRRFKFAVVEGHPGLSLGRSSIPVRRGNLVHFAIQHNIRTAQELASFDRSLNFRTVEEAIAIADRFRDYPIYAPFRGEDVEHEVGINLRFGGFDFSGRIDLLGPNFIVDFKTGGRHRERRYQLQLLIYSLAVPRDRLAIAYLSETDPYRSGSGLSEYTAEGLQTQMPRVENILVGITDGNFEATPSEAVCGRCRFSKICPSSILPAASPSTKLQQTLFEDVFDTDAAEPISADFDYDDD